LTDPKREGGKGVPVCGRMVLMLRGFRGETLNGSLVEEKKEEMASKPPSTNGSLFRILLKKGGKKRAWIT